MTTEFATFVDVLRHRANTHPDQIAYYWRVDEGADFTISYRELDRRATKIAAQLLLVGESGDRAILVCEPGFDYVAGFLGCLYAGIVVVPANPPTERQRRENLARLSSLAEDAMATILLTDAQVSKTLQHHEDSLSKLASLNWIDMSKLADSVASFSASPISPDALAFLQYTSGSTDRPKGVMVSHDNLIQNVALIQSVTHYAEASVGVSWLPPYHDMGLIGGILVPLFTGTPCVLMNPLSFVFNPLRWLKAITEYRATHSVAPNFAFELCTRRIKDRQLDQLDLSSWQVALCGSEVIRFGTFDEFADRFSKSGFRRTSFFPCYGLAEATLLVTGACPSQGPVALSFSVDRLNQDALDVDTTALTNQASTYNQVVRSAFETEPQEAAIDFETEPQEAAIDTTGGDEVKAQRRILVSSGKVRADVIIVDPDTNQKLPENRIGEIWTCGPSVAGGYWNNHELTAKTFDARCMDSPEISYLRTGDLGGIVQGELFVTGRCKDLIIINGRNIYPTDIEQTVEVSEKGVRPGCGAAFSVDCERAERIVVVYEVFPRSKDYDSICDNIRSSISARHDLELLDVVLIKSGSIPKTTSGKIKRSDCKRFYQQDQLQRVAAADPIRPKQSRSAKPIIMETTSDRVELKREIADWLRSRIAELRNATPESIDFDRPFTDFGLSSLQVVTIAGELSERDDVRLKPTALFDFPTLERLAEHIASQVSDKRLASYLPTVEQSRCDIAVVGMACRFPQADHLEAFHQILRDETCCIVDLRNRWDEKVFPSRELAEQCSKGGFCESIDQFDAQLFGISANEAKMIDPQHRILLETVWRAIENAGMPQRQLSRSTTGVFVGISNHDYATLATQLPDVSPYLGAGNAHSMAAGRVAYHLDLHGPCMAIDTACSSSLVAVHHAMQSLSNGECEIAIAGGVNLILNPVLSIAFSRANMLSPDGRCRAFSRGANGYVRGEGAGVIVLKRLETAQAQGDLIHAVLKGSAINQDGRTNGITAPNGRAQTSVIRQALRNAGVTPDQLDYIESHGTGTSLGDPIEYAALAEVLADRSNSAPCLLGSVKSNLGHLEAAAGIAGLIKTVLSVRHGKIFPNCHFDELNEYIDPVPQLAVATRKAAASHRKVEIAGTSSFGFSGTNCHIVVAKHVSECPLQTQDHDRPFGFLLTLSAPSEKRLRLLAAEYRAQIPQELTNLQDLCAATYNQRDHFAHRLAVWGWNPKQCQERLAEFLSAREESNEAASYVSGRFNGISPPVVLRVSNELIADDPDFSDSSRLSQVFQDVLVRLSDASKNSDVDLDDRTKVTIARHVAMAQALVTAGLWPSKIHGDGDVGRLSTELTNQMVPGANTDATDVERDAIKPDKAILTAELRGSRSWQEDLFTIAAACYVAGVELKAIQLMGWPSAARINLPGMPFIKKRYWLPNASLDSKEKRPQNLRSPTKPNSEQKHVNSERTAPMISNAIDRADKTGILDRLIEIVSDLLGASVEEVHPDAELLSLGADSLVLVDALSRVRDEFEVMIPMGQVFERLSTLDKIAEYILDAIESSATSSKDDRQPDLESQEKCDFIPRVVQLRKNGYQLVDVRRPKTSQQYDTTYDRLADRDLSHRNEPIIESRTNGANGSSLHIHAGGTRSALSGRHEYVSIFDRQLGIIEKQLELMTACPVNESCDATVDRDTNGANRETNGANRETNGPCHNVQTCTVEQGATATPAQVKNSGSTHREPTTETLVGSGMDRFNAFDFNLSKTVPVDTRRKAHLDMLQRSLEKKLTSSKSTTQVFRRVLADNRASSGFRPMTKEMTFPLLSEKATGSRIFDVDGNEFIDFTMGFGVHLLGHNHEKIREAILQQMQKGFSLGPQSPLAGEVATLLSEMTGHERICFCNTGTEAMMAAIRLARAKTKRNRIAIFKGSYHGTFDGILARAKNGAPGIAVPVAPGIPESLVEDVLVLEYGKNSELETLRKQLPELAAIIVEPIQSRNPKLQPVEFLHELRSMTKDQPTALIWDEVITGFRAAPGGAQQYFGIKADIAIYGKVAGGGMPIGIVAGDANYLDGIDGGFWSFGDDSYPGAELTFFAGTFMKHPLLLAAAKATLEHLKLEGESLQSTLNDRTTQLAQRLNQIFNDESVPISVEHFSSCFRFSFSSNYDLFFYHLMDQGIYIWEGRNCFLSTAHTDEDLDALCDAVRQAIHQLKLGGYIDSTSLTAHSLEEPAEESAEEMEKLELTQAQRRFARLASLGPNGNRACNICLPIQVEGRLDRDRLLGTVTRVMERHPALGACFSPEFGFQTLVPLRIRPGMIDLRQQTESERQTHVAELLEREADHTFDLTSSPLFRLNWIQLTDRTAILLFNLHHLICDGMSVATLLTEIATDYEGRADELRPPARLSDHLQEERRQIAFARKSDTFRALQSYFESNHKTLSYSPYSNHDQHSVSRREVIEIPSEWRRLIGERSRRKRVTPFLSHLALYSIMHSAFFKTDQILLMIPRTGQDLERGPLVANVVQSIPFVTKLSNEMTFAEWLDAIRQTWAESVSAEPIPFELIEQLRQEHCQGDQPFRAFINQEPHEDQIDMGDVRCKLLDPPLKGTEFDFMIHLISGLDGMRMIFDYRENIFADDDRHDWLDAYFETLRAFAFDSDFEDCTITDIAASYPFRATNMVAKT